MSVPSAFQTAIDARRVNIMRWLEIEGIPYAYGTVAEAGSFFAGRAATTQFLGIKGQLIGIPAALSQRVDTLEGGAFTSGQVEFTIGDHDDQLTVWTGIARSTDQLNLNGDHTATTTTLTFFGSPANYAANDYVYVGTETIKIGGVAGQTFTGCTRGMFRSTPQAFGSGYPVLKTPYTMANRRCWYNQVAVDINTGTLISTVDANRCVRFSGILRGFKLKDDGYGSFVLTALAVDTELDRPCFATLRTFNLDSDRGIMDADGKNGALQCYGWKGYLSAQNAEVFKGFNPIDFPTSQENFLVRIDKEIFYMRQVPGASAAYRSLVFVGRALFGTKAASHAPGAVCQEIAVIHRHLGIVDTVQPDFVCSKFTSEPTAGSPLQADHPLIIALQVLLSTGLGTNTAGGSARNYDVLPDGWGMGLDYRRVDIAAIEACALEEPNMHFSGLVFGPQPYMDWFRNILKVCGYYYIVTIGDILTIRRLRPPLPDVAVAAAFSNANMTRKFFTRWDANWTGAVRQLVFNWAYDVNEDKYRRVTVLVLDEADIYSKGLARTLSFSSGLIYQGKTGVPGELTQDGWDVEQWLLSRKDFYRVRYGRPPPIVRVRVDYSYLDVEVGDIVSVTNSNIPNVATGTRGITDAIGEIITKDISEDSKTIEFDIVMTGWAIGQYRFIAPALLVNGMDGGSYNSPFLEENEFTKLKGPSGGNQADAAPEASDGTTKRWLKTGTKVWVFAHDFSYKEAATITTGGDVGNPEVILEPDSGLGHWNAGLTGSTTDITGCYIVLRDYDSVTGEVVDGETLTAKYAFNADANDLLGTPNDPAHKLFPL